MSDIYILSIGLLELMTFFVWLSERKSAHPTKDSGRKTRGWRGSLFPAAMMRKSRSPSPGNKGSVAAVAAAVTKVKVFKEVDLEEGSLPLDRASAGSAASKASAAPTLSPVQSETSEVARVSEDWEASQKAREAAGERSSAPPPPSPPSHAAKEEGSPKANPRKVRVMAPAPDSRV